MGKRIVCGVNLAGKTALLSEVLIGVRCSKEKDDDLWGEGWWWRERKNGGGELGQTGGFFFFFLHTTVCMCVTQSDLDGFVWFIHISSIQPFVQFDQPSIDPFFDPPSRLFTDRVNY